MYMSIVSPQVSLFLPVSVGGHSPGSAGSGCKSEGFMQEETRQHHMQVTRVSYEQHITHGLHISYRHITCRCTVSHMLSTHLHRGDHCAESKHYSAVLDSGAIVKRSLCVHQEDSHVLPSGWAGDYKRLTPQKDTCRGRTRQEGVGRAFLAREHAN